MTPSKTHFKQRLLRIHVACGITFSLLMYIAIFFGIFAIFLPHIQVWEKPSRHFQAADITQIDYSAMIDPIISDPDFPQNNIEIKLPGYKNDPALKISHQFTEAILFNPTTKEQLQHEGDQSQLAKFLNGMHYGRPLSTVGYTIFGFMAVGVMLLIIGGLILVWVMKYNKQSNTPQSFFSKWHRKILTWVFPPFIIITLTGALMCVGYTISAPMTYLSTSGETALIGKIINPVLYGTPKVIEKKNDQVEMMPISQLIQKAHTINPKVTLQEITLINWKDSSAQIKLEGYNPYMPFLNGIFNKPTLTLSGVDGTIIENRLVTHRHWSVLVTDATFFLHLLFGVDIFTRIFIACLMIASCIAIGFGVMLWLDKKAKKYPEPIPFYHWMGKLSLSVMIGVFPALAILFHSQWLLPFQLYERIQWQQAIFFDCWLLTLFWSFYRVNSYQASKEFLYLAGILFTLVPFTHSIQSGFTPLMLWQNGMYSILSVDIALFLLGLILLKVASKLPTSRKTAKLFWTSKQKVQHV